jgi:hypothetical protein
LGLAIPGLCLSQIPNFLRTWGLRISTNLRLSTSGVLSVLVGGLWSLFRARAVSSVGKPGPPPPDRCPPALSQEATEAERGRPYSVGLAMRNLERLAIRFGDRQARDGHRPASEGLSPFLDMEDPTRPARTTSSSQRGPQSDPQNESQECALGRPARSRRIAQAGHRHRRDQRGQVHGTQAEAAFADLAEGVGERERITRQRRIDPA